jgi:hypothetical protein
MDYKIHRLISVRKYNADTAPYLVGENPIDVCINVQLSVDGKLEGILSDQQFVLDETSARDLRDKLNEVL